MKEYKDEFLAAPTEIKFLLYFAKMTKKDKNKLYHFLKDANNPRTLYSGGGFILTSKYPKYGCDS